MLRLWLKFTFFMGFTVLFCCCAANKENANTTATTYVSPPPAQTLKVVPRPAKILERMKQRGEQDLAKPVLKIISPSEGAVVDGPTVGVRLTLSGDLKGYRPYQDPVTKMGNHIHVILDNQPYEAYYDLEQPFELKNVVSGKHTLRVFPSRPWHESYKNEGAFQMVSFTVRGAAAGQQMKVDRTKPMLTYSRPKGEYEGEDAEPIMIDFWLVNAKLKGVGGEYRVRYIVDDDEPQYIDTWEPIWLTGWINGKHTVRLELLGGDQYPVENGDFNVTTREITVTRP